jgi:hypothetical protein
MMRLRVIGNLLPISDNEQCTAGNSGHLGQSRCHGSSLCWDPYVFLTVSLSLSNTFSLCYLEGPGFCPGHNPQADQHTSVLQQASYSHLKQEDLVNTPSPY